MCKVLDAPKENVRIMIQEMPLEHWGIAGESVKNEESMKKRDEIGRYKSRKLIVYEWGTCCVFKNSVRRFQELRHWS